MTRTGEVVTLVDNRQILSADSKEEQDALRQLLGSNNGNNGGSGDY